MPERLLADLRQAVRALGRAPLFTATAVLSLAVGLGANTTIFSAASALVLAPTRGVAEMDRLVDIGRTTNGEGFDTVPYLTYRDLQDTATVLSGVFATQLDPQPMSLGGADGADRVYATLVSASYFDVLGVAASAGTFFHTAEGQLDVPLRKVVLSHAFWQRRFNGDPAVVNREITLNGEPFVVAGVAAAGFQGTTVLAPDLWVPLTAYARSTPLASTLRSRESTVLFMGARLAPGVSIEQARQAVAAFGRRLAESHPGIHGRHGLDVAPASRLPGQAGEFVVPFLVVLMALVGLVLLVACANLAGLLLARATSRSREMAVRVALGASRWSVVRLLLVESVVLFGVGAAMAVLVASWTTAALGSTLTNLPLPVVVDWSTDWRTLLFTGGLALVTGLLTGLVPALPVTRRALRGSLVSHQVTPARRRLRSAFVTAQIAGCFVLVVVAGLFLQALRAASTVDTGLDVDGVEVVSLDLGLGLSAESEYPAAVEQLESRFAAVPGVRSVGVARLVPLEGSSFGMGAVRRAGDAEPGAVIDPDWNAISPGLLSTLGVPVIRGRDFTAGDRAGAERVGIVNVQFAERAWPGENPIGRVLETGDFRPGREDSIRRLTVVGAVPDIRHRWIGETPGPFIFVPFGQYRLSDAHFFLRRDPGMPDTTAIIAGVRAALRDFDRNLPLVRVQPFRTFADLGLLPQRIAASVASLLGGMALLLAAIGIYGIVAHLVASRTREIGVRVALGADASRIRRLVLGQGIRLTLIGSAIGLVASLGVTQLVSSLLFGVSPVDPIALGVTAVVLAAVALAASLVPARRAARLNPIVALRAE